MMNFKKKIISIPSLILIFFAVQCSDSPTSFVDYIKVDLPLKKKAVYAIAYYDDIGDSDTLSYLRISSFYFDLKYSSNDTTYLEGIYERLEPDFYDTPISGELLISLTDDWLFFQSSDIYDAGIDLMKPLLVDTTNLPTPKFNYFPIYPRLLEQDKTYSILRAGNYGDGWGYADVYREFNVKSYETWNDQYGSEFGFQVHIKHFLLGFTIYYNTIIDRHGIVNSQSGHTKYLMYEHGALEDTVHTYLINRRIVDYTTPSYVNTLSYYADEVREKGLKYIK